MSKKACVGSWEIVTRPCSFLVPLHCHLGLTAYYSPSLAFSLHPDSAPPEQPLVASKPISVHRETLQSALEIASWSLEDKSSVHVCFTPSFSTWTQVCPQPHLENLDRCTTIQHSRRCARFSLSLC